MRFPSLKRIATTLNIDTVTAGKVRALMVGNMLRADNPMVSRAQLCELAMQAIDKLLGTHGIEAIRSGSGAWVDSYHMDIIATYCNTGDTYAATVLYDTETGNYRLTSWGDYVETMERNGRKVR